MCGGSMLQSPYEYRNPQATPSPQPMMGSFSPQPHFPTTQNLNLPPFNGTNLANYDPNYLPPFAGVNNVMSPVSIPGADGFTPIGNASMPPLPIGPFQVNPSDLNANISLDMNSSEMRQLLSTELGNRDLDEKLSDSFIRLLNNNHGQE